jgi:hypothetical protein
MKIFYFDCSQSGASGDMILASLIDLGANIEEIKYAIREAAEICKWCEHTEIKIKDVIRGGIRAKQIKIKCKEEKVAKRKGAELIQAMNEIVDKLGIVGKQREFCKNALYRLLEAEARIHGKGIEDVHLHEIGQFDTIADIVGVSFGLNSLNVFSSKVFVSNILVGSGYVKFSHGKFSIPAPATLEILKECSLPIIGSDLEGELTTPTGASLLCAISAKHSKSIPLMKVKRIGYGAGSREFKGHANLLRLILGEEIYEESDKEIEDIIILETNVDDVDGERIGFLIERLLSLGVLDVISIPYVTKKSRPGNMLRVITKLGNEKRIAKVIMNELGTLGVRIVPCKRFVLKREIKELEAEVKGIKGVFRVKVAKDESGNIVRIKPEFEDIAKFSKLHNIPYYKVYQKVAEEAINKLKES